MPTTTTDVNEMKKNMAHHFMIRIYQRFNIYLSQYEYNQLNNIFANKTPTSLFKIKIIQNKIDKNIRNEPMLILNADIVFSQKGNKRISCWLVYNKKFKQLTTIFPPKDSYNRANDY
jgi:hypothetical protein